MVNDLFYLFLALLGLLLPLKGLAFCPLCVISTGALAGLFRWLGVDDAIIGLWLGAFITSSGIVINKFLLKRQRIKLQSFLILLILYVLSVGLFYFGGAFVPYNKIFGVNKIIFGIIFGNLSLLFSFFLDKLLRKGNQGRIFVSHQKLLLAVGLLLAVSLIFYLFIK